MYLRKFPTFRLIKTSLFVCIMVLVLFGTGKVEAGSTQWYYKPYECHDPVEDGFGGFYVPPSPEWYRVDSVNRYGYVYCHDPVYSVYSAHTNKDQYTAGEIMTVLGYADQVSPYAGSAVGLSSSLSSGPDNMCGGNSNCDGIFVGPVPTTPGTYTINFTGCVFNAANCANSSLSYTVVAPAVPSVRIWFGAFLDKIESYLEKIL